MTKVSETVSVCMHSSQGVIRIFAGEKGITQIDFLDQPEPAETTDHPLLLQAMRELEEYFAGQRETFDVPIDLSRGTEFQQEAWRALIAIPYGETRSYGEQARSIGKPKAVRAIGGANGKNPIPVIVPCHRVISSIGKLHGFSSGIELKRSLLLIEGRDIPN